MESAKSYHLCCDEILQGCAFQNDRVIAVRVT